MFCSLDRVDLAFVDDDGRLHWLQSDHRRPAQIEAEAELSLLFALIRLIDPRRSFPADAAPPVLEYRCQHAPPAFLRAAIASAGAVLWVDAPVAYTDPVPDPEALARLAFTALAARVARERGLAPDRAGLTTLEQTLPVVEPERDELGYWRTVVQLAAFTGEVLRATTSAQWHLHPDAGVLPFVLITDDGTLYDPLAAALDLVNNATPHALTSLLASKHGELGPA